MQSIFFIANTIHFSTTDLHQIWQDRNPCPIETYHKEFSNVFHLGFICPQNSQTWTL